SRRCVVGPPCLFSVFLHLCSKLSAATVLSTNLHFRRQARDKPFKTTLTKITARSTLHYYLFYIFFYFPLSESPRHTSRPAVVQLLISYIRHSPSVGTCSICCSF